MVQGIDRLDRPCPFSILARDRHRVDTIDLIGIGPSHIGHDTIFHLCLVQANRFGDLLEQPSSPKVHQAISERAMRAVAALGEEERALRANTK